MGGDISIIAYAYILEQVRKKWGYKSAQKHPQAEDTNLGSLIQHITFAACGAGDGGYYTVLNQLYERNLIRAWDFVNDRDRTIDGHHSSSCTWRGYQ
ncbi:hypothetical protein BS50DRAFT_628744 [Corynespora cassiicola Philippines]|uniref:Uncharacterized protein n=1 Tax=Corynespora cassiicola Philippines TaxID=1448308 RepID=A0A2T2PD63_CORCC|nr:hypothetical protein BS50DRAFT_628744 [Corynespora cassiicola Philippines]